MSLGEAPQPRTWPLEDRAEGAAATGLDRARKACRFTDKPISFFGRYISMNKNLTKIIFYVFLKLSLFVFLSNFTKKYLNVGIFLGQSATQSVGPPGSLRRRPLLSACSPIGEPAQGVPRAEGSGRTNGRCLFEAECQKDSLCSPLSSRGRGHLSFTEETGIQIPPGVIDRSTSSMSVYFKYTEKYTNKPRTSTKKPLGFTDLSKTVCRSSDKPSSRYISWLKIG